MSFKLRILSVIACLSIVTPSSFVFASEPSYSEAAKQLQQLFGKSAYVDDTKRRTYCRYCRL